MSNEVSYKTRRIGDSEIVSISTSRAQSLDMRELTVDTAEMIFRPLTEALFYTHEHYPFYTHDGYRFMSKEQNPFSGGVNQSESIKQYRDGSQIAVWHTQDMKELGGGRYKLNLLSPLGLLTQKTHYGGIYSGETAATVIGDIMGGAAYYIAPEFENIALYGWLPIATARDNLIQVLFAINAALKTDANGVLRIQNLDAQPSAAAGRGDIYAGSPEILHEAPITKVTVLEHNFVVGTERVQLFNGISEAGQVITFSEPMTSLQYKADGDVDLPIVTSATNYAVLGAGNGTLTGLPYIDTTREVTRVLGSGEENEIRVEKAYLVGVTASSDVADRLAEYYSHRDRIGVTVADKTVKSGDVINVFNPFSGNTVTACVASDDLAVSGILKSKISAVIGYAPWQTIPFEDERVLLTGSGTWTVPADVDEITVVLIGGGQGGAPGQKGESATPPTAKTESWSGSGTTSAGSRLATQWQSNKNRGLGGLPGTPGNGGKVLRVTLSVAAGASFVYNCGIGGRGAFYGTEVVGANGGDSVFGNFSSADGASGAGYFDPAANTTFATVGTTGVQGGNGRGPDEVDPAPVVYNGVTYTPGNKTGTWVRDYSIEDDGFVYDDSAGGNVYYGNGTYSISVYDQYGGGAAAGNNGNIDGSGSTYSRTRKEWGPYRQGSQTAWRNATNSVTLISRIGGTGADAIAPSKATLYGKGGTGGNGGGGGGGYAVGAIVNRWPPALTSGGSLNLSTSINNNGGNGSDGGEGADGCIIIYYRRPATNT